jgi:hypothetical protein
MRSDATKRSTRRYSLRSARAFAKRLGDRTVWYSGIFLGRTRTACRVALAGAGLPVEKEFLVLGCAQGDDASGLFSEVGAVLGGLEHYEARPDIYAGLEVDFKDQGLYYDPRVGDNWWNYYFEPLALGRAGGAAVRTVEPWQHDAFAERVEHELSRPAAAALLARHVRVRPHLIDEVERFWRDHVPGSRMVGIHYRGTDKAEESPAVPYKSVAVAARQALTAAGDRGQMFVATDEQAFLDYMLECFPGQIVYRQMRRSVDGRPIHKSPGEGFQNGANAVVDCLLLSKCAALIRTDSNLGMIASLFNPDLPVRLLGTP